jgi:N-glycosylase/DNA lyase
MLGSAVRHEQAVQGLEALGAAGLLDPRTLPPDCGELEELAFEVLASDRLSVRYRFPRSRAGQIAAAARALYWSDWSLSEILRATDSPREIRAILIGIPGLGAKQASLFMRNTGVSSDVAVLDCHVLRYLSWQGMSGLGGASRSLSRYEQLEDLLRVDADRLRIPLGELDRMVWLVMRVWQGRVQ